MPSEEVARLQGIGGHHLDGKLVLLKDAKLLGLPAQISFQFDFDGKGLDSVMYQIEGDVGAKEYDKLKAVLSEKYGRSIHGTRIVIEGGVKISKTVWEIDGTGIEILGDFTSGLFPITIIYTPIPDWAPPVSEDDISEALEKL